MVKVFNIQTETLLTLLILVYPLLFIWQCGDLTDTGYFAIKYQNFFENLKAGQFSVITFLSDFIGASYMYFFPATGVLGLKFLYILFLYAIIFLIYYNLKDFTQNKILLLTGIYCAVAFSERATPFIFAYDIISWLLLLVTGTLIIKGWARRNSLLIFAAGAVFSTAVLCRFPSIIFIIIFPFVLLYSRVYKELIVSKHDIYNFVKEYLIFLTGFITLFTSGWLILNHFNLTSIVILNFISDFHFSSSSHSVTNNAINYLKEIIHFFPFLLLTISLLITTSLIFNYSEKSKSYYPLIMYLGLLFLLCIYVFRDLSYYGNLKYFIPAFCFLPLLVSVFNKDQYSTLVVLFLSLGIAQLAGTNTGFFLKLGYSFMLLIPLSFLILKERKLIEFGNIPIYNQSNLTLGICVIFVFCFISRTGYIYHVDQGPLCRLNSTYPIDHNLMKGIRTTQHNAKHINEVCSAIKNNIGKENTLFIYGHQPLLYYLTAHQPPVRKYWLTNNLVGVDELFGSLGESIRKTGKWPVIVDTKQFVMGESGEKKLNNFFKIYNYKKVVDQQSFSLWKKM